MLIWMRRILFPTDFSEPARQAQQYAMALTDRFGAELHLLHVIPEVVVSLPDVPTPWGESAIEKASHIEAANQRLLRDLGSEWANDRRTVRTARTGIAVDEIVKYSKENDIDLIVLGTHGHTGLSHVLLGSVAEKVVRLAICPVLTVHPQGHQFLVDLAKPT